jgi:tetratricopeptide (TPR) repeat protein
MNKQTASNLFMLSPLTKYDGFYQELLKGFVSYERLGNRLIQQAEHAHAFRQFRKLKELALILSNIPIKGCQAIGNYFLAVAANSKGNGDRDEAKRLFELTIDTAPDAYKVKSILSLGALSFHKRDFDSALYFYQETIKRGLLSAASMQAIRGISTIKAIEGNHRHAVTDLERVLPVIKYAPSHIYFDLLNSYAVELGEAGRKDEARNIIKHVVASPFAFAYPEWQDTAIDLKEPNRSFISVPLIEPEQAIQLEPVAVDQPTSNEANPEPPTKVLPFPPPDSAFPPLKEAPRPKKPKRVTSTELGGMNLAQKREAILAAIRSGAVPDREYNKMMFMLGLVKSGPADHLIDLEDDAVLTGLIMQWAHMIVPEQLAAVMSALRDCKDDLRRANIIDNIIRKAFEYSKTCNVTESEWRLQVECRLPEK